MTKENKALSLVFFAFGLIVMGAFWVTWPITKFFAFCLWHRSCWP